MLERLGLAWAQPLRAGLAHAYTRNKSLFERSSLSGAVVFIDTTTRVLHEYPTEWRRITEEITG